MKMSFLRFISFTTLLVFLVSCSTESADETSHNSASTEYVLNNNYEYSQIELDVVNLINEYRVSKGLNSLKLINHISNVSKDHDEYMISIKKLTHDFFAQREENLRTTLGAVAVGEIIAYNYSTAQSVVDAWMSSPPHKANMEGNYTHFGISIRTDETGKKYFTMMFIRK